MSKYKELDRAILRRISAVQEPVPFYLLQNDADVDNQAALIAHRESRQPFRIIDGRMQAMRRSGVIRAIKHGWILGGPQ